MRKGKILSLNAFENSGRIEDENEQEIAFCLKDLNGVINVDDNVLFEIELTSHGLIATKIIVC
ncbi:MAG: hypothetical protein EOO90_16565 [Pedobacter sp.]|nr:MAG: hypothetical protein EOO90_16565 [Pedobacter sp.]